MKYLYSICVTVMTLASALTSESAMAQPSPIPQDIGAKGLNVDENSIGNSLKEILSIRTAGITDPLTLTVQTQPLSGGVLHGFPFTFSPVNLNSSGIYTYIVPDVVTYDPAYNFNSPAPDIFWIEVTNASLTIDYFIEVFVTVQGRNAGACQ